MLSFDAARLMLEDESLHPQFVRMAVFDFVFYYPLVMSAIWMGGALLFFFTREVREPRYQTPPKLPNTPPVTVLVPCYNEGPNVEETLRHALALDGGASGRFLHPTLVGDGAGPFALVAYGGATPDDGRAALRALATADGAATFGPAVSVSADALHLLAARSDYRWLGDYVGAAARGRTLYVSYASNDTTESHVAFARRALRSAASLSCAALRWASWLAASSAWSRR